VQPQEMFYPRRQTTSFSTLCEFWSHFQVIALFRIAQVGDVGSVPGDSVEFYSGGDCRHFEVEIKELIVSEEAEDFALTCTKNTLD
jgi:hypothetical protein